MAPTDSPTDREIDIDSDCASVQRQLSRAFDDAEFSFYRDGKRLVLVIEDLIPLDAYRSPREAAIATLRAMAGALKGGGLR